MEKDEMFEKINKSIQTINMEKYVRGKSSAI